jgi:HEAT repeats
MAANEPDRSPWLAMREQASVAAADITEGRPPFSLQLNWPDSYQQLLAGVGSERTDEDTLLERTLEVGRVLLASEAGSGKTWLLARLVNRTLASSDIIPILIQLKNLSSDEPLSQRDGIEPIIRSLLSIAVPDPQPLLAAPGFVPRVIMMVDGLNEVPRGTAEPVLAAVDELARRYPFLSVLISDRLVRRPIDLDRWKLATVLPLQEEVIRNVWTEAHESHGLPQVLGLLSRPFFLDTALVTDITASTESATIDAYFAQRVGVSQSDLAGLAETAFVAYATYQGRTMPEGWLRKRIKRSVFGRLIETDTIRTSRKRAWFTHHLLHDFLAARSLTTRDTEWGPRAFDIVTLAAASFDSLRLTVEQLPDVATADTLIRHVYDWNYYGAAYALVPGFVSEETRTVILAMLADKKWDPVWATVVQVTDALRFDGSVTAQQLLEANSREGLFDIVRRLGSSKVWFTQWVELFSTPDGTVVDNTTVEDLRTEDSITSWTLANVLRRCHLDESGMQSLLDMTSDNSAVIRWRAVHALGAHPSDQTAQALRHCLEDPDRWVRYGAIRSIVEVASRTSETQLRDNVFEWLMQLVQSRQLDSSVLRELGRALDVKPQPDGWAYTVAPLIQQLVGTSETLVEQDQWGRVMASILLLGGNQI